MRRTSFILILFVVFAISCKNKSTQDEGKPIVKVGNKILYSSVIDQLITEGTSNEDSAAIVNGYIENWIRDNLIIFEAEKNIPADLNLNKLVNDYRSSLILYHYENQLIKTKLDTIITNDQMQNFYDEYGSQFILSHKIINPLLIKSTEGSSSFLKWVKSMSGRKGEEILTSATEKNYQIVLDGTTWITVEDLRIYYSGIPIDKCKKGYSNDFKSKSGQYFVKILDEYNENEIPPLQYIQEKIEQVMLNHRKTDLLRSIRQELYQKNLTSNNIKYY